MISFKADSLLEMATNFAIPSEDSDPKLASRLSMLQLTLDVSHMIMCCVHVRSDCPDWGYSRRYPLATFMASFVTCIAGGVLSNLLLGLPLVADLAAGPLNLFLMIICWYLVFYSPFDICHRLFTSAFALKLPLTICKELGRARKISKGISIANSLYPSSVPVMIVIGTVKGNGSAFMRPLALLIQGCSLYERQVNEFLKPSFTTKATFLSCLVLIFGFQRGENGLAGLGYPQLVFVISLLLVYAKVALSLLNLGDPLKMFENLLCWICFGKDSFASEQMKKMGGLEDTTGLNQQIAPGVETSSAPAPQLSRASTMQSAMGTRHKID